MPAVHPSVLDPTLAVEGKKPSRQSLSTGCPQPPNNKQLAQRYFSALKTFKTYLGFKCNLQILSTLEYCGILEFRTIENSEYQTVFIQSNNQINLQRRRSKQGTRQIKLEIRHQGKRGFGDEITLCKNMKNKILFSDTLTMLNFTN